jgi:hypothetical protein
MIFTTNKSLRDWGRVLHDPDLSAAILDRVLERGRLITLDGPSKRTQHIDLDGALSQDEPPLRIPGKDRSDFPEPTPSNNRIWTPLSTSSSKRR